MATDHEDTKTRTRLEPALRRPIDLGRETDGGDPAAGNGAGSPEPAADPQSASDPVSSGHRAGRWILPQAVRPREVPPEAEADDSSLFFNRELSWIDFNWRVLFQTLDDGNPLLERARFLGITESNLDEFVMKRVGGLKRQREAGVVFASRDGLTPSEQLDLLREAVAEMRIWLARVWEDDLRGRLESEVGIHIRDFDDLDEAEREHVRDRFRRRIYPMLTPLAVDPGHPFPFISNLSLSLAVTLRHPDRRTRHFARVKIPTAAVGHWIELPTEGHYVAVEQVVQGFVSDLFRGMKVESASLFRVTRNADVRRNEEEADDLLQLISEELRERRFAPVVRLEVEPSMPQEVRELVMRELYLESDDVYEVPGLLDFSGMVEIAERGPFEHRFEPWDPVIPAALWREGETEDAPDFFSVIRSCDLIVHHPYDSFAASVQRFIEEAASDPAVLAIKQTVYRTSSDSPVVQALVRAAEAGKQVAVLVEVTARFDEASNMEWASVLEEAGVHVTYGLMGLKTHAKVALVLREEEEGIRTYCHIGTGNYHSGTAHAYADIGIVTARPEIGRDVVNLFHYLTGYAPEQRYEHLIVAPRDLRGALLARIDREVGHARDGKGGRLIMKMNGLDDPGVIDALYGASRAGVEIELIVRGLCRLRPALPGWSENIRVRSIVGRFLEHDRIFWFENAGDPEVWIGSADIRRRNLDDRVEVMMRIDDKRIRKRLKKTLRHALADNRRAWELQPTGAWVRLEPGPDGRVRDYQEKLMRLARKRRKRADAPWDIAPADD